PNGMNFSRRKLTQPLPPSPAWTLMIASSTNFMAWGLGTERGDGQGVGPKVNREAACSPSPVPPSLPHKSKSPAGAGPSPRCKGSLALDHADELAVVLAAGL